MSTWHRGLIAPLDHHLRPVMRSPPSDSSMRVSMLFASELATAGSVIA